MACIPIQQDDRGGALDCAIVWGVMRDAAGGWGAQTTEAEVFANILIFILVQVQRPLPFKGLELNEYLVKAHTQTQSQTAETNRDTEHSTRTEHGAHTAQHQRPTTQKNIMNHYNEESNHNKPRRKKKEHHLRIRHQTHTHSIYNMYSHTRRLHICGHTVRTRNGLLSVCLALDLRE